MRSSYGPENFTGHLAGSVLKQSNGLVVTRMTCPPEKTENIESYPPQ